MSSSNSFFISFNVDRNTNFGETKIISISFLQLDFQHPLFSDFSLAKDGQWIVAEGRGGAGDPLTFPCPP